MNGIVLTLGIRDIFPFAMEEDELSLWEKAADYIEMETDGITTDCFRVIPVTFQGKEFAGLFLFDEGKLCRIDLQPLEDDTFEDLAGILRKAYGEPVTGAYGGMKCKDYTCGEREIRLFCYSDINIGEQIVITIR